MLEAPLDPKDKKGGSLRSHLEIAARQGRRDPRLDEGKVPEGFEYLWQMFCVIRNGIAAGFSGVAVSWRDLADFQAVTGTRLDAFEVEAIMAMDSALRAAQAEEQDGDRTDNPPA